jgi:hypothetical protein
MPKVADPIPSRSFSVTIVGDDLDTLMEVVNESRRLKPEWNDDARSVLASIIEDFLGQADAFDQFILTRVDTEQRALLRQIAELKNLKKAARAGTLEEGDGRPDDAENPRQEPTSPSKNPNLPPPLGTGGPTAR